MQINVQKTDGRAKLVLNGRFDFSAHRDFRGAYEPVLAAAEVREVEIDFNSVDYLDSSALGMLLLLKERAGAANKGITLSNCKGTVKQVLDIANFGKLFTMQ